MPPNQRCRVEAHEIHRSKGFVVYLSLGVALSTMQVKVTVLNHQLEAFTFVQDSSNSCHYFNHTMKRQYHGQVMRTPLPISTPRGCLNHDRINVHLPPLHHASSALQGSNSKHAVRDHDHGGHSRITRK
ncbi:hypothetical protein TNCV_3843181 [Trichonephila clavipes]|nr:hypothetical protein TNCV_3843181 [Trichonephila clavipes]